jgi:hypothetical protein
LNVTSFSNFDELQTGEKIYIRLDVFHAIQRISKTLLHSHGAFQLFMARLKDAFFLVSKDDIDSVVGGLRSEKGYTDIQVQEWKSKNWGFILKYCRRAVPPKDILLARFDQVCQFFSNIRDLKTGKCVVFVHFRIVNMLERRTTFPSQNEEGCF